MTSETTVNLTKTIIAIIIIMFMTNLNALVDYILHPGIPYFDVEHIIVGGISFFFSMLFLFVLNLYLLKLKRTNKIQKQMIFELELKKEKIKENERKLKELVVTKDKLFSIIAHDLRSPFNSIIGFTELLFDDIKEADIDKSIKHLQIVDASAKNTLLLLDNLLEWARTQSGELMVTPEKINLHNTIGDVIESYSPKVKSKNINLTNIQSDEIEIITDPNMLTAILRNLIYNAIKFTEYNGNISINANSKDGQLLVSISDDGIGIETEKLNTLFKNNCNNTSEGTAHEKGSGFGLVLCKDFVEKLGGKIWVISEKGKGSEFRFSLPLNKYVVKQEQILYNN